MANSYTQLNIHVVFAVKDRERILNDCLMEQTCKYMHGILINLKQFPLSIGGYKNHVHLFFEQHPTAALSDIIEKVKANSSKWINDHRMVLGHFEWQKGYGGFSYSRSQRNGVIRYIMKQKEHHQELTFREEYRIMLIRSEIEFEDRYLFEFYE